MKQTHDTSPVRALSTVCNYPSERKPVLVGKVFLQGARGMNKKGHIATTLCVCCIALTHTRVMMVMVTILPFPLFPWLPTKCTPIQQQHQHQCSAMPHEACVVWLPTVAWHRTRHHQHVHWSLPCSPHVPPIAVCVAHNSMINTAIACVLMTLYNSSSHINPTSYLHTLSTLACLS